MTIPLLVMLGAAAGAAARWGVDRSVQRRHDSVFPWGTFVINVSGSLLLGGLLAAAALGSASVEIVAVAGTGFAGAFTTFSTFALESLALVEQRARRLALLNVVLSVVAGMAAAIAGWGAGVAIWG